MEEDNEQNYIEIDELNARIQELEASNEELRFESSFTVDL